MKIRVMVVEDNEAFFLLEKTFLEKEEDIELVGWASEKEEAITKATELKPDVLLLDINLIKGEDQTGVKIAIALAEIIPETKIIMLSAILDENTVRSTLGLGVAKNYVIKTEVSEIAHRVREVYEGREYEHWAGTVIQFIVRDYRETLNAATIKLTDKDKRVLELIYRGSSIEDIVKSMHVEIQTVSNQLQKISKKVLGWQWYIKRLSAYELAVRAKKMELF
ncbi:response regulator transcription factor [Bacillus sp. BRMEA1]|uniref:response regulator transcription factor n=1 Tax=Neobacillus endophyticus TaxID=2738405 RepID=UPI001563B2EC|nr:response regulator transcription factor [Neobacillus endophyticus]NRD79804.1 response regulator transcription factor [Neobacillus endophyticus]